MPPTREESKVEARLKDLLRSVEVPDVQNSIHTTARTFRNGVAQNGLDQQNFCIDNPSNFAKTKPGRYGTASHPDLVNVTATGEVVISKHAYVDDVVAFCLGAIRSNSSISDDIKQQLANFVNAMDARAVGKHQYSKSIAEKDYVWNNVVYPRV